MKLVTNFVHVYIKKQPYNRCMCASSTCGLILIANGTIHVTPNTCEIFANIESKKIIRLLI